MKMPIRITTLTPLHIGSGHDVNPLTGYAYFKNEKKVALVNDEKIFNLLRKQDSDLEEWIIHIKTNAHNRAEAQKLPFYEWLNKKTGKILNPEDIGQIILNYHPPSNHISPTTHALKTAIRSGNGNPLLPGSSIKGSCRTAFFTTKLLPESIESRDWKDKRNQFSDSKLAAKFLSPGDRQNDKPTHDLFRFIRFSDFHFEETEAFMCRVFSDVNNNPVIERPDLDNLLECIPSNHQSLGSLQIPEKQIKLNENHGIIPQNSISELNAEALFDRVNTHMKRLLESEIQLLKKASEPANALYNYFVNLQTQISDLAKNQCILRVGAGSGFIFTTGGWQESKFSTEEYKKLAYSARFGKNKNDNLPFPKSRKYLSGDENLPLGFIKVEILDEKEAKEAFLKREELNEERIKKQKELADQNHQKEESRKKEAEEVERKKNTLAPLPRQVKVGQEIEARIIETIAGKSRWSKVVYLTATENEKAAEMSNLHIVDSDRNKIVIARIQKLGFDGKSPAELTFIKWK